MKAFFLVCLVLPVIACSQSTNFDFERIDSTHLPEGWPFFYKKTGKASVDSIIVKNGKYSFRIERKEGDSAQFTSSRCITPVTFKGLTITFKAWIKTDSIYKGFANLYMRADDEEPLAFTNSQNKIPASTNWTEFSISAQLPAKARRIFTGFTLSGYGRMWIDHASLLIDSMPVEALPKVTVFRFERQTELQKSAVSIPKHLAASQLENLEVLCRVWGFAKYFHQQVAKGKINMDSALFKILPDIIKVTGKNERSRLLVQWLNGLGTIKNCDTCNQISKSEIFREPDLRWMENRKIYTADLTKKLTDILKNRNADINYYVDKFATDNPDFSYEAKYKINIAGDDGMRLLALFRYWNSVEYFFPSKYLTAENWNRVLTAFIPLFIAVDTDVDYKLACAKLVSVIHDTHAANIFKDSTYYNYFGNYFLPFSLSFIKNRLVVKFYRYDSSGRASGLEPGDEIISINNMSVRHLVDSLKPYTPASNQAALYRDIASKLERSRDTKGSMEVKKGKQVKKIEVQYYWYRNIGRLTRSSYTSIYPMYKKLDTQVGYINLEKIQTDSLATIFKTLKNTKGIIIDIRNYPSDFMPFAMGYYLKQSKTPFVKFSYSDYSFPGRFYMFEGLQNGGAYPDYYKGKVVILVNEETQSQAEYTTMALKTVPGSVVIGSQTAGADGNVSDIYFPGGLSSYISALGVYYPDGKATQGIGIVPQIICKPTIEGIKAGRDELIARAMKWINEGK